MQQSHNNICVTGLSAITPVGTGADAYACALKQGRSNFSIESFQWEGNVFEFPVAKPAELNFKEAVSKISLHEKIIAKAKRLRHVSASALTGIYCALDAWQNAAFDTDPDFSRVAIVAGGTNTQQATLTAVQKEYREKLTFINPNYGLYFFDSDIVGILSELLGIQGEGHVIGAASASGNMSIIQACRLISSGEYDVVVVTAPAMDLSIYEYQGFTALEAMAKPGDSCRPFDAGHTGFVYGKSAGCLILESAMHAASRGKTAQAYIEGYGLSLDANRNPNPSAEGETIAMQKAMQMAGIHPQQVNYVNTHGTGSGIGDKTEVQALLAAGLKGVKANSTKSIIGHALSAAGLVECIASILQMKHGFLHASLNLHNPITDQIDWIQHQQRPANLEYVLSNSFGFGGINTSIIIKNNQQS